VGVSQRSGGSASRPFVTTPYDASGAEVVSVIPARGPCWSAGSPCRIRRHHRRKRKTGPPWGWVHVVRCVTHRRAFTIYPPGHVPYGREPLVELAPDGGELGQPAPSTQEAASPSLFAAARAAAEGVRWPREGAPSSVGGVRTTQRRHIARAADLLGLAEEKTRTPSASVVAGVTGLAEGELVEVAAGLASSSDLLAWGHAVARVVGRLRARVGRALMDRLAVLGHLAGLWGRPYRWLARTGRLLALGRAFWTSESSGTRRRARVGRVRSRVNDIGPRDPP